MTFVGPDGEHAQIITLHRGGDVRQPKHFILVRHDQITALFEQSEDAIIEGKKFIRMLFQTNGPQRCRRSVII